MPRYDYQCNSCENVFEVKQRFTDEPVANCPICDSPARRKFYAVPVIYKGSGFYTTDYARSSLRANGTGAPDSSKDDKPASSDKSGSSTEKKATAAKSTEKSGKDSVSASSGKDS